MKLRSITKSMNSKKADIASLIIVGILLIFVYIVISIVFAKMFGDTIDIMKNSEAFENSPNAIDNMNFVQSKTIPYLDFFIFFSLIGAIVGLIISSIYIDVHPALMMIFMVALFLAIVIAGYLVNAYDDIKQEEVISDTASQFTLTNLVFGQYFPAIIFVVGMIIIVILYGKSRRTGEV
jgi:hypothetical protein